MSKLNFDNLKEGQWIVVIGIKDDDTGWQESNPWMAKVKPQFDGVPLEVLCVDLPFILVESATNHRYALDVRQYEIQRCSKRYVAVAQRIMTKSNEGFWASPQEVNQKRLRKKKRKIKVKRDPRDCPNCGTRMREQLVGDGVWRKICPDCGFDKGTVEKPK